MKDEEMVFGILDLGTHSSFNQSNKSSEVGDPYLLVLTFPVP